MAENRYEYKSEWFDPDLCDGYWRTSVQKLSTVDDCVGRSIELRIADDLLQSVELSFDYVDEEERKRKLAKLEALQRGLDVVREALSGGEAEPVPVAEYRGVERWI